MWSLTGMALGNSPDATAAKGLVPLGRNPDNRIGLVLMSCETGQAKWKASSPRGLEANRN